MREISTVNQLTALAVLIEIDETPGAEKVTLTQDGSTITLQHDRAEAVIGAIRYGLGEIASTPA